MAHQTPALQALGGRGRAGFDDAGARGYGELAAGWPVVLSAMRGIGLGLSPLPFYTAGSFAPHLHAVSAGASRRFLAG